MGADNEKKLTIIIAGITISGNDSRDLFCGTDAGAKFKLFSVLYAFDYSWILFNSWVCIWIKKWDRLVLSAFYKYHFFTTGILDDQYESSDIWLHIWMCIVCRDVFGQLFQKKER